MNDEVLCQLINLYSVKIKQNAFQRKQQSKEVL